ncbi:hypothetical protein DL98DRAFT_518461 [Cadophora sp. DSE1049]|nr:hypothetical protein DL98DRAFT_518461 [Cadophora sp. DSE1049]
MSTPSSPEPAPFPEEHRNKPMSWEDMRKIYPQLPEKPPVPTRTVECNSMSYTDGEGVQRQIWIPKGTLKTACKHLDNKNWAALTKFPTYVDQGYADEGEAEEKERKTWEWLVEEDTKVEAEPVDRGLERKED